MRRKLEVESLSKSYGSIRALRGVDFYVGEGEYFCILGPTGAGKTTLLKVIAGLLKPDEGRVYIDGVDVTSHPPEARGISYMPQGYALFPHMTVWDNVAYGARARGIPLDRVREALELVGLYDRRDSYPHELSGGQQQRVALARALAAGTDILLLDEPLGALDLLLNIELRYELRRMAKELGLTVLHVTQDVEEALSIADRVLVLRRGVVQQIGAPAEVYLRPSNLFVANFLGELNLIEGKVRGTKLGLLEIEAEGLGLMYLEAYPPQRKHVVVAYRPEDVVLGGEEGRVNVFEGAVRERELIGFLIRYVVDLGEISVRAYLWPGEEDYGPGTRVEVYFPPESALLFPYPEEGLARELALE